MRVYNLMYDGEHYIVEAPTLGKAVKAWRIDRCIEWGSEFDGTEEPESIHLINESAVIHFHGLIDNKIGESIDRKFNFIATCREHSHECDENHSMVFLAKDAALIPTLREYRRQCEIIGAQERQLLGIDLLIERVIRYQAMNPERVKVPDVDEGEDGDFIVAPNLVRQIS